MRLEPLYRVRFTYPESWSVGLDGGWQQMFFLAKGRCEGSVTGRFRGANFPRKEGADGPFRPDFRAVIEADDGAVIMVEWHGTGSPSASAVGGVRSPRSAESAPRRRTSWPRYRRAAPPRPAPRAAERHRPFRPGVPCRAGDRHRGDQRRLTRAAGLR
jgi:hypothetical protein